MASSSDITFSALRATLNDVTKESDESSSSSSEESVVSNVSSDNENEESIKTDVSISDVSDTSAEYSEYTDSDDGHVDDDMDADNEDNDTDDDEDKAINEIKYYQNTTHNLIPFKKFKDLVQEIGNQYMYDIKFTKEAYLALQTATEAYVIEKFQHSQMNAVHAGRTTIAPKDVQLSRRYEDDHYRS